MTTVYLAPGPFGAGGQFFGLGGLPLTLGTITTYAAGGTTPLATYTTSVGNVPNANPIVLGADGRPPNEIWITAVSYRFDLKDALGNLIKTYDNLSTSAANLSFLQSGTGAVARTVESKERDIVSVTDFGALGDGVTNDTAAFNLAIAASANVFIPAGTYLLSALSTITRSACYLWGLGRSSTLKFNTTTAGIPVNPNGGAAQVNTFIAYGLNFQQVTNVPASFISLTNTINPVIEKCYFSNTAATYCVDNISNYGTKLKDCVFSNITGSGFRNRAGNGVASLDHCDFTGLSVNGIEFASTTANPQSGVHIDSCVVESCVNGGILFNTGGGGGYSWNVHIENTDFESNTGFDISLNPNGAVIESSAVLTGCQFASTPTIDLGNLSYIQFNSCHASGGNAVVVSGSGSAAAFLLNCTNITQSGTFAWTNIGADAPVSFTPTWTTGVAAPTVNTGFYYRVGRKVTVEVGVTMSGAATGTIEMALPITAANNAQNGGIVGVAMGKAAGVNQYLGAVWISTASNFVRINVPGTANVWDAANPAVWANTNTFSLSFTYFV